MKVVTYLGFTLLSILIQFCVMDYIQERTQRDNLTEDFDLFSHKKHLSEILKDFQQKPHALYYQMNKKFRNDNLRPTSPSLAYSNSTVSPVLTSPSLVQPTTLLDVFYDENSSQIDNTMTTESMVTTTEMENYTEITLFGSKNESADKPTIEPKKNVPNKKCACNLLQGICDINCCCDGDCSDAQVKLFLNCFSEKQGHIQPSIFCSDTLDDSEKVSIWTDNLFCIAKSNAPEKRNIIQYATTSLEKALEKSYKWDENEISKEKISFAKNKYKVGDPIWFLKNGSVGFIDLPSTISNDYCVTKRPIMFLKEQTVKCLVKLQDLEMFHILTITSDTKPFSVSSALDFLVLNCSTVHCANWTVLVCEKFICSIYNQTLHEPMCMNKFCTGIALHIEYVFYYFEEKITNATVKLFPQNVSLEVPYMKQEISVKFYLSNDSIDNVVKVSGNPGFLEGYPLIVSYEESNHTELFFNTDNVTKDKYWPLPFNKQGMCDIINEKGFVLFGQNLQKKCRLVLPLSILSHNGTDLCKKIQSEIFKLLRVNKKLYVSPLGNPYNLRDNEWILLKNEFTEVMYGHQESDSKVKCFNLVNRISLIFTYADVSELDNNVENKIIRAAVTGTAHNTTFDFEDISLILTVDINFMDVTKPPKYEYASSPNLHIHLPKDFFFPFPSSSCYELSNSLPFIVLAIFVLIIK